MVVAAQSSLKVQNCLELESCVEANKPSMMSPALLSYSWRYKQGFFFLGEDSVVFCKGKPENKVTHGHCGKIQR